MLTMNELALQFPYQLWLDFSEEEIKTAWASLGEYSYDAAKWNAYLNRLCLNILIPKLEEESGIPAKVWPSDRDSAKIWEFLNGSAITIDKTRLILIPSEAISIKEFSVPQEWIDIPNWVGDYYLAVQVNLDDGWLRVWGYTTHQQLKNQGIYDDFERNYSLKQEDIFENVQLIWLARELCDNEQEEVNKPPTLSKETAEILLAQLSEPTPYSPRLNVDFEQWAAIISNENLWQKLYETRLRQLEDPFITSSQISSNLVNLTKWFENVFESGWQTFEEVLGTKKTTPAFRNRYNIQSLIEQIYTGKTEEERQQAAEQLGVIDTTKPEVSAKLKEVIAALIHLIRTTEKEETRWAAAESLWIIDPDNPVAGAKRVKDLGIQLWSHSVALMVAVLEKNKEKSAIFLRVYPMNNQAYLPPNLQLIVLDEFGQTFLETKARNADNLIQLKFSGNKGERFSVKVALGEANITQDFVI